MTIDLDKLERELLDHYGCSDLEELANYHGTAHTMLAELRKSQRSIEWLQTLAEKHSLDSARSERELQEAQATIERVRELAARWDCAGAMTPAGPVRRTTAGAVRDLREALDGARD